MIMPTSEPTGTGRWKEPSSSEVTKHADLYEVVYIEAQRTLDDQASELTNIRTRAVQFLAFVGASSGFLIGAGIHSDSRGGAFYGVAVTASAISFLSILCVCLLLAPWMTRLRHRVRPGFVLKKWIERDVPAPSKGEMLRELALHFENWRRDNKALLERAHALYIAGIALGGIQLLLWAALVWMNA